MNLSIVLATFKRPDILNRTLDSFCHLACPDLKWELWVVDNADDSDTREVVDSYSDKIPAYYLVEPKAGKNNALNRALAKTKGQLLVFTDDDILAKPDWLLQLWEGAQRWPDHKVFGGRIVADWPDEPPFWGDDHPLNQSLFSLHCPSPEERPYREGDFLPYGPNMAVRREIFDLGYKFNPDIGPTNSTIYRMGSETEFLQRLKDDGYTPVFLPKAVVKHQIRPEQLTPVGLNRRNFRVGLSDITPEDTPDRRILGCAPHLWKQLTQARFAAVSAAATGNRLKAFETPVASGGFAGKCTHSGIMLVSKSHLICKNYWKGSHEEFISGRCHHALLQRGRYAGRDAGKHRGAELRRFLSGGCQ